ncbi:MAG: hypothetical protein J6J26_06725 [Bacteroides sp.]|nr:hypothetical protein [Bacteroides sp.]
MKAKHLLMAMALPVAFASCSQDELVSNSPETKDIPLLAKDFALTANKTEGLDARGAYENVAQRGYVFKWTMGQENLGVCWTGKVGDVSYTDQTTKELYSNYLFTMAEGAAELESDGDLKNPSSAAGNYEYAKFTTTASSLFAGEYVVYSPYTSEFKGVGKIKAVTPNAVTVTGATKDAQLQSIGQHMFLMSGRTAMVGGQDAANFTLGVKSTILELKLQLAADQTDGAVSVDKIILFDETKLASSILYDADGGKGTVTYGHQTISATYSTAQPLAADINALDQTSSFLIPVLTENLKATTKIYVHDATSGKWAIVPFTAAYELQYGIKPLTLPSLKANQFTHTLVTSATELAAAIAANTANIDILTDITLKQGDIPTWNTSAIKISSATGAKLVFDVKTASIAFGGSANIDFACDVEVKDSTTPATNRVNTFTMAAPATISGDFTNNLAKGITFNTTTTIAEGGNLINNGKVTLTASTDLIVMGGVTNNASGTIVIPANAGFNVSGRNAQVTNAGTIKNDGAMAIIKYNTNSVVNNGIAVVGVAGTFTGDFDATSTGSFWKEVNTKAAFEDAIAGIYTKVIVLTGTYDYSAIQASKTLNAGSKDIEFKAAFTMPSTVPAAGKSNNFTLTTTGKVTINTALTLGRAQDTPAKNYPTITLNAGEVEAKAGLIVEATGVLNVSGDVVADGAAVQFLKGATVSFVDYTNKNGGSLYLATGANVTYTGKINL